MLGYLSADIICSEKQTVFREQNSRKTVSYKEQIMSKDKHPSIFSLQMATIRLYYPSNLFCDARSFENWGIFSDIQSCDPFRPITYKQKDWMDYNA